MTMVGPAERQKSVISRIYFRRQLFMWNFIIIILRTSYVTSNQNFQINIGHLNKQLLAYKLFDMTGLSHHRCVTECMFTGACVSVNFVKSSKTCELNSAGSETAIPSDFVEAPGTIFSDVSEWPQSIVMGCVNHQCSKLQRCYPHGIGDHTCVNITCENPLYSQHGVVQSGSAIAGTVRTYVFKCPDNMFAVGDKSIRCQENGKWSPLEAVCTETTLGSECADDTECKENGSVCNQGYCFCSRLHRYDHVTRDCVQVCTSMADTFIVTRGMRVSAFNDVGISKEPLANCRSSCISHENCSSFEYNTDTTNCRKSSLSKQMVQDALPERILFDNKVVEFYQRDCS